MYIFLVAVLYSLRDYIALAYGRLADPFVLYLSIPFATIFSIVALRLCFSQSFLIVQYHAVLLQLCGIFIVRGDFDHGLSRSSFMIFLASALSSSLALVSNDTIYKLHHTTLINTLNIALFASSTLISGLVALILAPGAINHSFYSADSDLLSMVLLLVEAGRDIAALSVLFYFDAAFLGVASALGSAIVLTFSAFIATLSSVAFFAGCVAASVGSVSYMLCYHRTGTDESTESTTKK
jgi:hypothetical protein